MAESIPKTMSGILIEETGGPDKLVFKTDLPVPELKEGEVLVKNEFIGINYIDIYFRTGVYPEKFPLLTGQEAAGVVVATHPSVSATDIKPGDRVAYMAKQCYAAYTAAPLAKTVRIPDGVPSDVAAASVLQGLTALSFVYESAGLHRTAHLGLGQGPWVLVHAAAGGTGSLMVQVLAAVGAKVIGTAGGPEKCEIAKASGAKWVIDSKSEDIVAKVKEFTNGAGVDVIFDGVGKATFDADLEAIARRGTLVVFGAASGAVPPVELRRLSAKNIKLMRPVVFAYTETREEFQTYANELFDMIAAQKVRPSIYKVYPLQEVAQAHIDLEGRKTTGKLLLKL